MLIITQMFCKLTKYLFSFSHSPKAYSIQICINKRQMFMLAARKYNYSRVVFTLSETLVKASTNFLYTEE